MIHFRSNIQTAEFGLYQMSKHSAPLRVYKSDMIMNLLHGFYIASICTYYLIHEKECFTIFKTRGAAERFRYDKTRLFECIK